jgi:two-component system, OmpR family, sensor kinase
MSLSLRWRLAIGIVVAFTITLLIIFFTMQVALGRLLTNDLDNGLSTDAQRVLAQVAVAGELDDAGRLQRDIQANASTREDQTPFITVIRDLDGNALLWTQGVQEQNLALTPEQLDAVLAGDVLKWTKDLPGDRQYRVRTQTLTLAGQPAGVIQVARVTETVTDPLNRLLIVLLVEGIVATAITVLVALWLSRDAVKPLQKVVDVAAEIQASDLTRRISARNQAEEVQKLADTFDAMLERLDAAFQEQRNFVMDVSHELRTPLTVLKGNIDVMLMDPALTRENREQYERMSSEVSRLIRLTSNLLYLASADAGREPERRPVELDVVCLEVLRQSRDLKQEVKVAMGNEDEAMVIGDRDQLKQMILNLVENAIKYTPPGGEVKLSLNRNGSTVDMSVSDTGPGIPPELLPNIFERFNRGENRGIMGGTGLGLAIASRIARAHGGDIRVDSTVGKGSEFTVSLPLAPEDGA